MYVPEEDGYLMPDEARIMISKIDSHKQEVSHVSSFKAILKPFFSIVHVLICHPS